MGTEYREDMDRKGVYDRWQGFICGGGGWSWFVVVTCRVSVSEAGNQLWVRYTCCCVCTP